MIGDLIIWIKLTWKKMFCIHEYKVVLDKTGLGRFDQKVCDKCKRSKFI